jgi:hypothetical protein
MNPVVWLLWHPVWLWLWLLLAFLPYPDSMRIER